MQSNKTRVKTIVEDRINTTVRPANRWVFYYTYSQKTSFSQKKNLSTERLTRVSERSAGPGVRWAAVVPEKVRVKRSGPVAELELDLGRAGKVREPGLLVVQRARAHVQRETSHLPRAPVERAAAHGRELLQPALFAPLVLEPHLRTVNNSDDKITMLMKISKNRRLQKALKGGTYEKI